MRIIGPRKAELLRKLAIEANGDLELVREAIANVSQGRRDPGFEEAKAELEKLKREERPVPAAVW